MQKLPNESPVTQTDNVTKIVESVLAIVFAYLTTSNHVCTVSNPSKKKISSLFPGVNASQDSSVGLSRPNFLVLSLTVLTKLLAMHTSVSDGVTSDKLVMQKLLQCLNLCSGQSFELLDIGVNILSWDFSNIDSLDKPKSIEDGVMKVFCLIYKHSIHKDNIMKRLLSFMAANDGLDVEDSCFHLSELLQWILLKLLDVDKNFEIFVQNGKLCRVVIC